MKKLLLTLALVLSISGYAHAQTTIQPYAVSPYWQSDLDSYTFFAITHPSLSGTASQIGLILSVQSATGGPLQSAGRIYTISAGDTQRVFIVTTNHNTITAANYPAASFIVTTSNMSNGNLRFYPVASNPDVSSASGGISDGTRAVRNLSLFGGIVFPSSGSIWAMEFIGDLQSSKN